MVFDIYSIVFPIKIKHFTGTMLTKVNYTASKKEKQKTVIFNK